ncbi:MAG: fumarylacetoacetate hydrolase family protein [Planctomycetota bacterium]
MNALPEDGTLVGRVWNGEGPLIVVRRGDDLIDVTDTFPTMSRLINDADPLRVYEVDGPVAGEVREILRNSEAGAQPRVPGAAPRLHHPHLLAPNDLLATKACGVTFIRSLLERVVEEKAKGDPAVAQQVRGMITEALGDDLSKVAPGSPETQALKKKFIAAGVWSQYLEVGIGPDPEVFTKAQPMASVGYGAEVGVLPDSSWNNPEPEVVLTVSRRGEIRGATLGNDVNLRDYEGRSALLLGEAKDQNGSCAIGPMIRLFDESFTLADVEACEVELHITGVDGFETRGRNRMAEISRKPADLVAAALGPHHQYPDGMMLFLGTMFAPTDDRDGTGGGFTHKLGDRVEISTPSLGTLVNTVNHTDKIPPWTFGAGELFDFLQQRRKG